MSSFLRVLSWNVHDLLGDPLAVARVLRAARADVACLQEAPRWPGSRGRLGALAAAGGMVFVAGGRASAGTAVLTSMRTETQDPRAYRLPTQGWRTRPRGAATALVGLPGTAKLRVTSIHLGLTPEERAAHVALLLDGLGEGPELMAGDLNEPPTGPSWLALGTRLHDPRPDAQPTHPARAPRRRIDGILLTPGTTVTEYGTWHPDEADALLASDHRPTLALVELPPAPSTS